jgi:hypothetical protein
MLSKLFKELNKKADGTTGMGESNHLNRIIIIISYAQFKLQKPKSAGGASLLPKN